MKFKIIVITLMLLGFSCMEKNKIPAPPDVSAIPENAETRPSGLASRVLKTGIGTEHPTKKSYVSVQYTGWTSDGKQFDTSEGGKPVSFYLDRVIPGWTEGVQLMVAGEKRRFWIPSKLAYEGMSGPQGMLVFDVELFSFK